VAVPHRVAPFANAVFQIINSEGSKNPKNPKNPKNSKNSKILDMIKNQETKI
jgi:hypothetical protein